MDVFSLQNILFPMQLFLVLGSGLIGVCVGSFLAARAVRTAQSLPQHLWGRSICLHCKTQLTAKDLIPILSHLLRKGKCAYCRAQLPSTYSWIELSTAVLFMLSTLFFLVYPSLLVPAAEVHLLVFYTAVIVYFSTLSLLIYICSVDILILAFPVGLLGIFTVIHLFLGVFGLGEGSMSRLGGLSFFVLLLGSIRLLGGWIKKSKVMGDGDLWLGALIGASLGIVGSIVAFYASFITGALLALGMMSVLGRKKVLGKALPFGPFLCLGWFIAYFFGTPLFALLFPIS